MNLEIKINMEIVKKYIENLTCFFEKFKNKYGLLGCGAVILVILKFIVFYHLMSVKSNALIICLISWAILYFLFTSFKNKLIPSVIYLIVSILMFADVTYCSFFNKYLSVAMIGSASMLGDVTASIKEIMRPINFFMLIDAIVILAAVIMQMLKKNKDEKQSLECSDDFAQEELKKNFYKSRISRKREERKRKRQRIKKIKNYRTQMIPIIMIVILIMASSASPFIQSIAKQEFFTYHIGDVVTETFGLSEQKHIMKFEDSYENEKNGPLFGVANGKNLVVIQIESYQNFLLGMNYNGQEITPFLNSLIEDKSVYFDNYYQQVGTGNTSDAEFETNNSIMGSIEAFTYQLYEKNYFRGLPVLLKEQGYETAVLHAHENRDFWNRDDIYPNLGFDHYYGGLIGDPNHSDGNFEMTEWMGWGLTDSEFYPQAMEYIKELQEPFYSFVITLSNHHPYEMLDKYKYIDLKREDEDTLVGNYLNSAAYTDYALSKLFEEFKKAGLYEDTVFALYGDHMGLPSEEQTNEIMERLIGHEYDWDDRMNIPLIIHIPSADDSITTTIHNAGGQTDFLPTIAYVLGFDHLDTIYLGHNLFNYDKKVVAEHAYLPYGSFFIDGYGFEMSRDGVFKNGRAWDLNTRKEVDVDQFYDYYMKSREISDTSIYILKNDILRKVYEEGKSREEVF